MDRPGQDPTHYDVLQLHPAAPLDLITAVYWRLAGKAQSARSSDPDAERTLRALTRAYEALADASTRAAYDRSLGIDAQQAIPKLRPRRGGLFGRGRMKRRGNDGVDYYEILRVAPVADPAVLAEAYDCLRDHYRRSIHRSQARPELMDYLEEAYAITSDAERRGAYDESRNRRQEGGGPVSANLPTARPTHDGKETTRQQPPGPVSDPRWDGQRSASGPKPAAAPPPKEQTVTGTTPVEAQDGRGSAIKAHEVKGAEQGRRDAKVKLQTAPPEPSERQAQTAPPANGDHDAASPLRAIGGGASSLARRLGRQFDSMRKREMELEHEAASRQGQERAEDREAEEALAQRLAARMSAGTEGPKLKGPGKFRIQLVDGPGSGVTFDLKDLPVTLGADEDCDVTVPAFEGHRARLLFREGLFLVHVIADGNAPEKEGTPAEWWVLEDGADFRLGSCVLRLSTRAD